MFWIEMIKSGFTFGFLRGQDEQSKKNISVWCFKRRDVSRRELASGPQLSMWGAGTVHRSFVKIQVSNVIE